MKTNRRGFLKGLLGAAAAVTVAPKIVSATPEISGRAIMAEHGPTIGEVKVYSACTTYGQISQQTANWAARQMLDNAKLAKINPLWKTDE